MKKLLVLACATATLSLTTGSAIAESIQGNTQGSIQGKVGITGRFGFQIPADGDYGPYKNSTDAGFTGGGGILFGYDNHIAIETDITHSAFKSDFADFGVTNVSLGAQYRFMINPPKLVPYLGAGLDILMIDADQGRTVDTTVGVHASAGADYFIMKQLALTAEAKLVLAPDTDIKGPTGNGTFDPNSFSTTFGIRFFF